MTFDEYKAMVLGYDPSGGPQRRGQYAFNLLMEYRPWIAENIRTSASDPFYLDERLERFLDRVSAMWERP